MATYSYQAITVTGSNQTGVLEAASEAAVLDFLHKQGWLPVRIQRGVATVSTVTGTGHSKRWLFFIQFVSQSDILVLTRQLASMLKAGLPLDRTLGIVLEITPKPAVAGLVQGIQQRVRSGQRFADALEASGSFSRFYVNMVRAGEVGGSIEDALLRLLDYLERARELRNTVVAALIYPAILTVVAGGSVLALLMFVVPRFADMFDGMGAELPAVTRLVMAAGSTLQHYWWGVLGGLLLVLLGIQYVLTNARARFVLDRYLLRWPVIGNLTGKLETARFARSLGTLLHNGVPLLKALQIARNTLGNRVLAAAVDASADNLKQGASLTRTLLDKQVFPAYALHMLRVGEETGRMEELLHEVAEIYDTEVRATIKQLLSLLEPLLILVMALAILVIIGAVLLPMINMADLVK